MKLKKLLIILSAIFNTRAANNQSLQNSLAHLEINLEQLAALTSQQPSKPVTPQDFQKIATIKILFTNYQTMRKVGPAPKLLEELKEKIDTIKAKYNQAIALFNAQEEDEENKITEPPLENLAAFTAWYEAEKDFPKFKEIEAIHMNEKFTRLKTITSKKVLENTSKQIHRFNQLLEDVRNTLSSFTDWIYEPLQKNPPTYQTLKEWSKAKQKEIEEQLLKAKEPAAKGAGSSIKEAEYCKLPAGTTLQRQEDHKMTTIILGTTDISPYLDKNKNLTNITSIIAIHEVEDGKLIPAKKGRTFNLFDLGAQLDYAKWLKSLPAGSGWCDE